MKSVGNLQPKSVEHPLKSISQETRFNSKYKYVVNEWKIFFDILLRSFTQFHTTSIWIHLHIKKLENATFCINWMLWHVENERTKNPQKNFSEKWDEKISQQQRQHNYVFLRVYHFIAFIYYDFVKSRLAPTTCNVHLFYGRNNIFIFIYIYIYFCSKKSETNFHISFVVFFSFRLLHTLYNNKKRNDVN